jgi:4-methyl-5(b-hydroxyethyl)-thiazole monophosphate biosynthesis
MRKIISLKESVMKKVLVPLAQGFEEIEAMTIIDVLRRAGLQVITCHMDSPAVTGSHGITVTADAALSALSPRDFSMIALPGGMPGAKNLQSNKDIIHFIEELDKQEGLLAAICAAPIVLAAAKVITGKKVTCYPGFEKELTGATPTSEAVVRDGRIITGNGPGSALVFALKLVSVLTSDEEARKLATEMMAKSAF